MSVRKWVVPLLVVIALLAGIVVAAGGMNAASRYVRVLANDGSLVGVQWDTHRVTLRGGNAPLQPELSPQDAGIDAAALELAAQYAADRNSSALLVMRRGHRVFERYFAEASAEDRVDVGEWSQVLVALSVGAAVGDRKIALIDEPAANYLPEWRGSTHASISLRHLLENTSGLRPAERSLWPRSLWMQDRIAPDLRSRVLARGVSGTPGRTRVPQPADATLAALVVERATGTPYLEYLSTAVWQRLGAADAEVWLDGPAGHARVDCCLRSRAADWLRVAELLVQDGVYQGEQIVPPGWVPQMLGAASAPPAEGWFIRRDGDYAARDVYRVEAGGEQRIWLIPSLQLAIVRTGRAPAPDRGWDDATIPDLIARATTGFVPRAAPAGSEADPSLYAPRH